VLEWRYRDKISWHLVMIGLREDAVVAARPLAPGSEWRVLRAL
jgi:hypothetical protein